jgi:hypothetical protein
LSFQFFDRDPFQGAKISSDTGILLLREIDERFGITSALEGILQDSRKVSHTQHSCTDLLRQRVYQIAAGYEDCNDANELRKDPALRLALDKNNAYAASQSLLSRFENKILGNLQGLHALDGVLQRSIDPLLKREGKARLILDLDSSEDPAHGRQEGVNYNGHFRKNCYHPLFCFTSSGICLSGKLREGNVHSAHGALEMLSPIVERYRKHFKQFWLRGDAAFAKPELYAYCEAKRMTYFIRLKSNNTLKKLIEPHLERPTGNLLKSGIQEKFIDLSYQAGSWEKPRRVVCRIAWHESELFPQIGFVVTNSRISVEKVIKLYHHRAEIENRIKEGKNTLRWDKTSCHRFESNEARLKMGLLAYNLLHLLRKFYIRGEGVRRSIEWLIRRLIKVGAKFSYHARRWQVQVSSAFALRHHYLAVIDSG